ncbi:MAG: leucine-rich repeat protein [Muribaculaceae bacterium]|nr:leucine-rich repeat protein [Muribaculaceae bacterium]
MKKILLCAFSVISLMAWGQNKVATCGYEQKDGLEYSLNDGVEDIATVTRCVTVPSTGKVIIPETITSDGITYDVVAIGDMAFYERANLKQVEFRGNKLTSIGNAAFGGSGLTSVSIPASVTFIDYGAFMNCRALTRVTLPEGMETLPDHVLYGCSSLKDIKLPASLKQLGASSLGYTGITSLVVPEGVTTIGNGAVAECQSLKSITLPASLTTIDDYGIYGCPELKNIRLPRGLKTLGEEALSKCGMPYILLPEGLTTIGNGAMSHDNVLKAVNIPSTVTKMEGAFSDLTGARRVYSRIKRAYRPGGQTFVTCIPGFTYGGKTKFYVPQGSLPSYQDVSPWSMMNMLVEEVPGDVDDNNTIDVSDMSEIINHVLGKGNPETAVAADVDRSCDIDVADTNVIINKLLNK